MSENSENKEIKSSGLKPPTKIPTMGVSRMPSSSSIKLGNSVVLTEDTDSFIIGDRVWVGGTKPGHIAYIGETNFGTGDWAGIVLDEPIGKNDGSVGGTKYFQCSPKKGIFARLTNLTNAPLGSVEDSMVQSSFANAKPLGFSTPMPKRQTSNVSAVPVTAAVQRSVVKNVNQTPASKSTGELKVGDRVIISSGQGSKLGVLRYRGATQFAPGEWCGIELDDPLGKNNGTVEGIKYFECEDKFGLFAPIGKVSKSPMSASRMSSNCAIHKTNKRSPGSMSGSMISGITATTMSSIPTRQTKVSDLDKLKTQLTQLKNENELLRLQVTKAANQADVAEKQLEETIKAQNTKSSQDNSLSTLQSQLDTLKKHLDDEREKFQNLQFTIEEQNVANAELQNKNGELLIKIKEQQADLEKERNLAKDVEVETMKNFEKEEELCRLKEELDSLKKVINNNEDELQKSVSNLSTEVNDKDATLNVLRQQLNESTQNHERVLKEMSEKLASTTERLNKIIEEKDKQLEQNKEMIEQLNEGIKSLSALKNEEHDEIVNGLKNEMTKLKEEHRCVVDQNERDAKKAIEQRELMVKELNDKLDGLSDTKSQEIGQLQEKYNDALRLQSADKQTIENLKSELNAVVVSLDQLKVNNFIFGKDVLEAALKQQMESAMVTVKHLEHQFAKAVVITDKQIETCNTAVLQIKEQMVKSKAQTETLYEAKLKEKEEQIEILTKNLNELTNIVEQRDIANKELNDALSKALKSAEEKSNQIVELEKKYNDLDSQQNLSRNELEKELTGQLKTLNDELADLKTKKSTMQEEHEKYVREMVNSIGVKEQELNDNKTLIENLKSSLAELQTAKQNDLDAQSEQLARLENEKQDYAKRHDSELTTRDEQIKTLSDQLEQTLNEKQKQHSSYSDLQKTLNTEISNYQTEIGQLRDQINDLQSKIALDGDKANGEIELSRKELENIKSENAKLLDALKTLEHEKTTVENQLQLIGTLEKDVERLNEEIEEKSKTIAEKNSKIEHIGDMAEQAEVIFNNKLKTKDDEIERLSKAGEDKLVAERSALEEQTKLILEEKEKENAGLREKLNELDEVKNGLEKQLEISKTHELQVNALNETVQEKMKTIAENNAKIDELNDLVSKIQHEFEVSTKEKDSRINEILKGETEKLELEKIVEQCRLSMDEKDREIVELKNCLQEVAGKDTEKELILRLESVNADLEKERNRAVNLESLKCDLEKKISDYKKDLERVEETKKTETSKSLDEQREYYTEQINHIRSEVQLLNEENLKVKSDMEDYKSKWSALQATLNDKNQETENLKVQLSEKSTSNNDVERLETLLEKQRGDREHLEFRIQELTDENHRLNERIENVGKPLQDNNLINEKHKLEKKYEETYSMLKIKENQILVLQTELNSFKLKDIAKVKNDNVQEKTDAHILAEKNEEVKMLNSIILSLHKKLSAVMETDVSDYEIDKNPNGLTKEEYQKLYKTAKNNVKLKECENMALQQEISKLKTENDRFAEYKIKCDSLEKDKKKLQQIVVNNESSPDGDNNKTGTKSETMKILEEKDWQINLLNNIIADLHAKVSDNKFKMESLEKQILDSGSGQNKKARIRTARLYCEQCEIFDAHDTEDCPEKPESPKFQKKHKIVTYDNDETLKEEPFCVCCDMFGHTANECDSSLTF